MALKITVKWPFGWSLDDQDLCMSSRIIRICIQKRRVSQYQDSHPEWWGMDSCFSLSYMAHIVVEAEKLSCFYHASSGYMSWQRALPIMYQVTSTQQAENLEVVDTPPASWRACLHTWPFLSSTRGCYYLLPSTLLLSLYSKTKLIQMVRSIFFSNFSILTGLSEMWRKNKNCNETTKLLKNGGAFVQAESRQCRQ